MVVAALVTGNTVILKPSEQTSIVAYEFSKLVYAAGVPVDAYAFLPGRGEVIGRHLVESPKTSMIAFTGSRPVGLEIIKSAANVTPSQMGIKRVVAELGGKNAIIIDEDADFDDSIRGVLTSAFGFAGQKCSACSRVIVVGDAYEPFITRLAAATVDINVGPTAQPSSFYGPVIDEESYARITGLIKSCSDVTLLAQGTIAAELQGKGWYVPPTIFRDVPTTHTLWRDEIFGPVVACVQARSFDHALELANDSEYALTGGVFSRNPSNIEKARTEFRVGNLYINRGITGALVCRQPFGGFKFSGIGSKAGGKDYLLQFLEPRTVTENTMRRGFTPDLNS
jgi:RHH-type proline utilization regulon transcriptional repressor/proline dehydrogenase/delta 1-pyrroline-5-carboxylate dehydrogenase